MLDLLDLQGWKRRGRWVGLREFAIFAAAYLTYFGVRALTEGSLPQALANAGRIAHVERLAGVEWEDAAQSAILGHHALVRVANWVYMFGHWPLLLLTGVLLFRYVGGRGGHQLAQRRSSPPATGRSRLVATLAA